MASVSFQAQYISKMLGVLNAKTFDYINTRDVTFFRYTVTQHSLEILSVFTDV
jgi:hypothetical protein